MSSRAESEKQKQIQEKCQAILGGLLREEDNKYCVDCDAKGPRWASWNLGIFLCIRCAGIHRNLGVHISKVKSVNLDTWTPEQVACLQQMGNSQARAVYEANLPDNFRRPQIDPVATQPGNRKNMDLAGNFKTVRGNQEKSLESFIRSKYEQKKYIAKEWVPPPPPKPAFDIEDEKKKQKEKKKNRSKVGCPVEIPAISQVPPPAALPRPHSSAPLVPATKSVVPLESDFVKPSTSPSSDLLTLGETLNVQQDDIFDAFLSAPQVPIASQSSPSASNTESLLPNINKSYDITDLFTEMSTPDPLQNKMTKENILSLYGNSQNQQQPQQQQMPMVYGVPGRVYIGQQNNYIHPGMIRQQSLTNQTVPNGIGGLIQQGPGMQQLQQQMANIQIQGQMWNTSGVAATHMPSPGMIGTDPSPNNVAWPSAAHSLSSNLWR